MPARAPPRPPGSPPAPCRVAPAIPAFTFLGTGPGSAIPGRFQSSLLLEIDDRRILLDAGEPCCSQLLNFGVPLESLDAIWLTHVHTDHNGGISTRPDNCPAIFVSARKGP